MQNTVEVQEKFRAAADRRVHAGDAAKNLAPTKSRPRVRVWKQFMISCGMVGRGSRKLNACEAHTNLLSSIERTDAQLGMRA